MTGPRARVRMSEKHGAVAIGQRMLPVVSGGRMLERETDVANQSEVHLGACEDLGTPQPLGPVSGRGEAQSATGRGARPGRASRRHGCAAGLLSDPFQPAVVVFEDTQWADEATLEVIKFLGRRIGRLLVLT